MTQQHGHRRAVCKRDTGGKEQWTLDGKPIKEDDIPVDAQVRGCPPRAAAIAAKEKMSPGRAAPAKALPAPPPKKGAVPKAASPPRRKLVIADRRLKETLELVLTPAQFDRVVKTYEGMS